jgi:hypothetical protein
VSGPEYQCADCDPNDARLWEWHPWLIVENGPVIVCCEHGHLAPGETLRTGGTVVSGPVTDQDRHEYAGWANGLAYCSCGARFDSVQALDAHLRAVLPSTGEEQ